MKSAHARVLYSKVQVQYCTVQYAKGLFIFVDVWRQVPKVGSRDRMDD